jgi:hypothetical protein
MGKVVGEGEDDQSDKEHLVYAAAGAASFVGVALVGGQHLNDTEKEYFKVPTSPHTILVFVFDFTKKQLPDGNFIKVAARSTISCGKRN